MRSLLCLVALLALPAFATGETIVITGAAAQLNDTLCISMTCVTSGARDFVITGKQSGGTVELTVTSTSGQRRLTHTVPLNEFNRMSSTDLVTATSLVQRSIEVGALNTDPKPAPKLAKTSKKLPLKRAFARR
ncbi:MAG: hypothetical protein ACO1OB_13070 [Archangium sp.]